MRMSLRAKLILIIAGVSFTPLLTHYLVVTSAYKHIARQSTANQMCLIARMAAEYSVGDLASGNKAAAERSLWKLSMVPEIEDAQIYDEQGRVFAAYWSEGKSLGLYARGGPAVPLHPDRLEPRQEASVTLRQGRLEILQPIATKDRAYGTLRLVASAAVPEAILRARLRVLTVISLALLLLTFFLAWIIQGHVSRPILWLAGLTQEVSRTHDYSPRAALKRADEIGTLAKGLDGMLASLQAQSLLRDQAEERLRFALETIQTGAWDLNLVDHTAFRSLEHDRIFGYAKLLPLWTYETFLEHVVPEDRAAVDEKFRHAMAERGDWRFECRIRRVDGGIRYILAAGRHHVEAASGMLRMAGIVQDITERKAAEEALRESRRKAEQHAVEMQAIMDAVPAAIFISHDVEGRRMSGNRTAQALLGLPADANFSKSALAEERSVHFRAMRGGRDIPPEQLPVQRAARGEIVRNCEFDLLFQDGTVRTLAGDAVPLRDAAGHPTGAIGAFIDITELKRAEMEMLALNQRLAAANKELESFSYSVAHDLRSPLRAIDGFSQALLEDHSASLDAQGREYLGRTREGVQRMAQMIEDLLKLARLGYSPMASQAVDLSAWARDAAAELRRSQPGRQAEFVLAPGLVAAGDPVLLRSVIRNLLDNAWKFTAKKPRARIEFGAAEIDGQRAFFVRDDGAGFDMAYSAKLFGVFQRLHTGAEFPGSGIGLAMIQRIIQRHGGRVWAEGAVGQGATFYFTLPGGTAAERAGG